MTNKNTTRNFLAGALATASVATLMLVASSTAFATDDTITPKAEQLSYQKAAPKDAGAAKADSKADSKAAGATKADKKAAPKKAALATPKLASFDRTQTAPSAAFSADASFSGNAAPVDGDLVIFSNISLANGRMVADQSVDVILDLAGVTSAQITVIDSETLTLGGVINRGSPVAQGLIVSIDGTTPATPGTLNLDASRPDPYGASNIKSGDYSGLANINFTGGDAGVVNIKANNFKSGVVFGTAGTASGTVNLGVAGTPTNITLSGDMGKSGTLIPVAFNALDKSNTTFTGSVFSGKVLKFNGTSQVTLSGTAYAFNGVNGNATSTLAFAGDKQVSFDTATGTAAAAVNVSVDGSTAVTHTDGGAAQGMKINTLSFTNTSKAATGGSFQLADGRKFADYGLTAINSTAGLINPEVQFFTTKSGAQNQIIAFAVGNATNPVNLRFMDIVAAGVTVGNNLDIQNANFFGKVYTNTNGVGDLKLSAANGRIDGIGEAGKKLQSVAFTENAKNFGDTYAGSATIYDGKTVELGGTVDATVKLANSNAGGATLKLRDNVSLLGNVVDDLNSTNNTVEFLGSAARIGSFGDASAGGSGPLQNVIFSGKSGSVANFNPNAYVFATNIDFKDTAINISRGNAAIHGVTNANINSNITLGSSELILNGNATLGSNTSITTTLTTNDKTNVQAGSINVAGTVDVAANSNIVINVTPGKDLPLAFSKTKVVNVSGSTAGTFNLNGSQFTVNGKSSAYSKITASVDTANKNDVYLTGIDNSSVIVPLDVKASGGDSIDQQNAALLTSAASGDAALFIANTSQIDSANDVSAIRGNAIQRLTNSNSVQIASVNQRLLAGSDNAIIERVSDTALQVNRNELGQGAPAAGDEARAGGAPMGAWLAPVYSQETQKGKGGSAGYKVKSGGAIVGIDTQANDNLIIGAAATMVSSDMKMKDYKAGDKAKINSFMFSLYGAQELVRDFFVQGVASFSSSKIKGKERRIVPTSTNDNGYEIANANYDSIGFSGKVLFGYNAKPMEGVFLTPVAGLRYSKTNDESYTETGTSDQNKSLSNQSGDRVDAIVGIQVETNVKSQGIAFVPEAHVYVTHKVGGKSGKVNATLDGLNTSFIGRKDTTGKTLYNAGLGVKTMFGAMEYGASYDAYFASKYIAHQGSLKVRVNF